MENKPPKNGMELKPSVKLKRLAWKPVVVSLMAVCGMYLTQTYTGGDMGRLNTFQWRQLVAIEPEMVEGEEYLLDFPVQVHLQQNDWKHKDHGGKVQHPQGFDLRFTGSDGADLIPQKIDNYNPKTGELTAWINIDTLYPDKRSFVYLYFGSKDEQLSKKVEMGSFQLKGHFVEGGKAKQAMKNKLFTKNWLQTEVNNQREDNEWVKLGLLEELDAKPRIEYGYFKAALKGGAMVLIEWSSDKERNNHYFQVQRSETARSYQTLGKLGGSGKNDFTLRYSFSDPTPIGGGGYYRLKQVDRDGTYAYTNPISVSYDLNDKGIELGGISPNPFNEFFVAQYSSSKPTEAEIIIYDGMGQIIEQHNVSVKKGDNLFTFKDKYNLTKGAYVFSIMGPDKKLHTQEVRKTYDPVEPSR